MMNLQERQITNWVYFCKPLPITTIYDAWIYLQNLYMRSPYYWLLSTDGDLPLLVPRVNSSDGYLQLFILKMQQLETHYIEW